MPFMDLRTSCAQSSHDDGQFCVFAVEPGYH